MERVQSWPEPGLTQAAPTPVGVASRLEFGLACIVVFLAPINVLKLSAFYFTASDAFACLCLVVMAVNHSIRLRSFGPGTGYWIFGLLLMIGALLASSLLFGSVDRGLIMSMQYLFAYFLLPVILLARPWPQTVTLMRVFVGSMVVMVAHGVYVVDFVGETNTLFVSGSGRFQGFVGRENECGALIALTIPTIFSMVAMRMMNGLLAVPIVLLLVYGLMLTGSNTALYGMLLGLSLFFLARLTPKRIGLGIVSFAAMWTALQVPAVRDMLPPVFKKRVLNGLESGDLNEAGTFADRMLLNEEAIRLGGESLLLGHGADQYREISGYGAPVHNLYLLLWNEGGLLALVGFLIMLSGAAISIGLALSSREGRNEAVCGATAVSLFAVLISAAPHVYGRFWTVPVLLALAPVVTFLSEGPRRQRSARTASRRA